jgi:hypothetical protein
LNVRALEFTMYPKEMLASVTMAQTSVIMVGMVLVWLIMDRLRSVKEFAWFHNPAAIDHFRHPGRMDIDPRE